MATEQPSQPGGRALALVGWVLVLAGGASQAAGTERPPTWYTAKTADATATACLLQRAGQPAWARVTVVDRRGHVCDVAGALSADSGPDRWQLDSGGPRPCRLTLVLQGNRLTVQDGQPACQPLLCGEGLAIGSRRLTRQARPTRPVCEAP